jgi:hypothetical protein
MVNIPSIGIINKRCKSIFNLRKRGGRDPSHPSPLSFLRKGKREKNMDIKIGKIRFDFIFLI